jgi:hypothetical protein
MTCESHVYLSLFTHVHLYLLIHHLTCYSLTSKVCHIHLSGEKWVRCGHVSNVQKWWYPKAEFESVSVSASGTSISIMPQLGVLTYTWDLAQSVTLLAKVFPKIQSATILTSEQILYNFDRFIGHVSQGVPDVPKYRCCCDSQRVLIKGQNCDLLPDMAILA